MARFVICLFVFAHLLSGLSVAAETGAWLDTESGHAGHELHAIGHDDAQQHDEAEHHFCHHNLVGLAVRLSAPAVDNRPAALRGEPPQRYSSAFVPRLLRPPRR